MPRDASIAALSRLGASTLGVFRAERALDLGVTRKRLAHLCANGVIERLHPGVYRMTAVATTRSSPSSPGRGPRTRLSPVPTDEPVPFEIAIPQASLDDLSA